VSEADGFASALEVARRTPYDLLITDLHFPDGDGWDLYRRLNADGSLPAIVVSGSVLPDEVPPVRGVCTFLTKPIRFDDLLAAVARCHHDAPAVSSG
jgi:CheY-like chemotaxis protein